MSESQIAGQRPPQETVTLGGGVFSVPHLPGTAARDEALAAAALIADHAPVLTGKRVLIAPCGNGLLGAWAARAAGADNVHCLDSNAVAVAAARATLDTNGLQSVCVRADVTREQDGPFDAHLMLLPKGRDLARLWLLNSVLATREGGDICIAGPNGGGIQSFARDADILLGKGTLLAYRRSNRIFRYRRPPSFGHLLPVPFDRAGVLNGSYHSYPLSWAGRTLKVCTRPGVFSRDELDEGTQLLLSVLEVHPDEHVLDLGCGAGVIGLAAALNATRGKVTLTDVDSLAIECACETLRRNGVKGPEVLLGDGLQAVAGRQFSLIVTNPPYHAGHQVSLEATAAFVQDSCDALVPGGRLVLVSNRFLPYEKWLRARFDRVDELTANTRYRVFSASRSTV